MTTQDDSATSSVAPKVALLAKGASVVLSSMLWLTSHAQYGQKKTRQEFPRGFGDNVQTLLLAGTIAIRTHAPLARHIFYVFFHTNRVGVLAHYVGDRKSH
jgi:hypothetical protein